MSVHALPPVIGPANAGNCAAIQHFPPPSAAWCGPMLCAPMMTLTNTLHSAASHAQPEVKIALHFLHHISLLYTYVVKLYVLVNPASLPYTLARLIRVKDQTFCSEVVFTEGCGILLNSHV